MWRIYRVEKRLDSLVGVINDTLENHCKKGVLIERSLKQAVFRFMVSQKKTKNGPAFRAEGVLGKCHFIFRSDSKGASFSSDQYNEAENTFFQFAIMIDFYRKDLGLETIEFDSIGEIVEQDSPPVRTDNYALFDEADIGDFQKILDKKFYGAAHKEVSGNYSVIVYSENARITKYFCEKNISVYQKLLADFKTFYGFKDAMLVCARKGNEQYVYFYAKEAGFFFNTQDAGGEFLKHKHGALTDILSTTKKKTINLARNR
jgi:hypothetical protein